MDSEDPNISLRLIYIDSLGGSMALKEIKQIYISQNEPFIFGKSQDDDQKNLEKSEFLSPEHCKIEYMKIFKTFGITCLSNEMPTLKKVNPGKKFILSEGDVFGLASTNIFIVNTVSLQYTSISNIQTDDLQPHCRGNVKTKITNGNEKPQPPYLKIDMYNAKNFKKIELPQDKVISIEASKKEKTGVPKIDLSKIPLKKLVQTPKNKKKKLMIGNEISSKHAVIEYDPKREIFYIADIGSAYGTYVFVKNKDDLNVHDGESTVMGLFEGDVLNIANHLFKVEIIQNSTSLEPPKAPIEESPTPTKTEEEKL